MHSERRATLAQIAPGCTRLSGHRQPVAGRPGPVGVADDVCLCDVEFTKQRPAVLRLFRDRDLAIDRGAPSMSPPPVSDHAVVVPQSRLNRQGQEGVRDTAAVDEHHRLTRARRVELQLDAIYRYAFHRCAHDGASFVRPPASSSPRTVSPAPRMQRARHRRLWPPHVFTETAP